MNNRLDLRRSVLHPTTCWISVMGNRRCTTFIYASNPTNSGSTAGADNFIRPLCQSSIYHMCSMSCRPGKNLDHLMCALLQFGFDIYVYIVFAQYGRQNLNAALYMHVDCEDHACNDPANNDIV